MKITIKTRFSDAILFEGEYESTRHAVESAIKSNRNLCDADLRGANLFNADLCGADLCRADLCGANLRGADLRGANLFNADLRGADLRGANLFNANLYGANLFNANLCDANLRGANLFNANLCDANLRGANLYGEKLAVTPIVMTGMRWQVMITAEYLTIGCERHAHGEWRSFDRVEISKMDKGAWDWWQQHKDALLALCEINAAQAKAALEKENAA